MIDKSPISIKEFKGLHVSDIDAQFSKYAQGDIPFENALECLNFDFLKKGGLRTRNGIDTYVNVFNGAGAITGKPVQMWKINNLKGILYSDRWLILTWDGTNGRLYDTGVTAPATNPIGTFATMKYANVINAFGRMYIAPWKDWAAPCTSFPASDIQVYTGDYNVRAAGGTPPGAGAMAVAAAATGSVTPGLHLISVIYETDTGFRTTVTANHQLNPLAVTTAANQKINVTGIPVGGAGTGIVKRHVIMTKVAATAIGGFSTNEPFIVVTIPDNTTTTATIDLPDSALVDSAKDEAFPNLFTAVSFRSCVSLVTYKNRLCYVGALLTAASATQPYINDVYVSPPNIPEHVSIGAPDVLGASIKIGPYSLDKVVTGAELDGVFYAFKGNSTYRFVEDLESDPSEWPVEIVDSGKGAYPFGVLSTGRNPGTNLQGFTVVNSNRSVLLVAGNHGLSLFNGAFIDFPLSEFVLEEYTIEQRKWSRLCVDPIRNVIFFGMGDPYAAPIDHILVGNYYYGPTLGKIRWGKWNFATNGGITPTWIAVREPGSEGNVGPTTDFNTLYPLLTILSYTSGAGPTYSTDILSETNRVNDYARSTSGHWISWAYETGYTPNEYGEIYQFAWMYLRALVHWVAGGTGGSLNILGQYANLGNSALTSLGNLESAADKQNYLQRAMNVRSEKCRVRISGTNRVFIQNLSLAGSKVGTTRPSS